MSLRIAPAALLAWLVATPFTTPAAAAITGVCPDGSIFIVQEASAVPCRDARRVDPSDVPPIQPEFLPRPYGWERFHRRSDPNNPYNVIESQRAHPGATRPPPQAPEIAAPPSPPPVRPPALPRQVAALVPQGAAPPAHLELGLTPRELADLDEIVALLQSVTPVSVSRVGPEGQRRMTVQLARSVAFEQRLHAALARRGARARGPVLLFRVEARAAEAFHGHLTFVQGHVAFHPDPANVEQLGLLVGAMGELAPGQRVLGYAVLPEHLDPARPLDIYWNDLRIEAQLSGGR